MGRPLTITFPIRRRRLKVRIAADSAIIIAFTTTQRPARLRARIPGKRCNFTPLFGARFGHCANSPCRDNPQKRHAFRLNQSRIDLGNGGVVILRSFCGLVNPRTFVPDLDCVPAVNVAYNPTRFEHDPCHGLCSVRRTAFGYFHTVDKDEDILTVIVKLADAFVIAHGSTPWAHLASFGNANR
jgi:hypothetical protein